VLSALERDPSSKADVGRLAAAGGIECWCRLPERWKTWAKFSRPTIATDTHLIRLPPLPPGPCACAWPDQGRLAIDWVAWPRWAASRSDTSGGPLRLGQVHDGAA